MAKKTIERDDLFGKQFAPFITKQFKMRLLKEGLAFDVVDVKYKDKFVGKKRDKPAWIITLEHEGDKVAITLGANEYRDDLFKGWEQYLKENDKIENVMLKQTGAKGRNKSGAFFFASADESPNVPSRTRKKSNKKTTKK